jgi:maltose-binding protein MalE
MLFMGSYAAADLEIAAKEKGFNWTVLPLLRGTTMNQGANPQTFSINALSTKKKEAARFIQFMMQDQYLSKIALGDALIPLTSGSLTAAAEAKKDSPGWKQIFADGGNFTLAPFAYVPEYAKWRGSVLQPALQQFIQNKISKDELKIRVEEGWKNLR